MPALFCPTRQPPARTRVPRGPTNTSRGKQTHFLFAVAFFYFGAPAAARRWKISGVASLFKDQTKTKSAKSAKSRETNKVRKRFSACLGGGGSLAPCLSLSLRRKLTKVQRENARGGCLWTHRQSGGEIFVTCWSRRLEGKWLEGGGCAQAGVGRNLGPSARNNGRWSGPGRVLRGAARPAVCGP